VLDVGQTRATVSFEILRARFLRKGTTDGVSATSEASLPFSKGGCLHLDLTTPSNTVPMLPSVWVDHAALSAGSCTVGEGVIPRLVLYGSDI
jgi:hypothetical protein